MGEAWSASAGFWNTKNAPASRRRSSFPSQLHAVRTAFHLRPFGFFFHETAISLLGVAEVGIRAATWRTCYERFTNATKGRFSDARKSQRCVHRAVDRFRSKGNRRWTRGGNTGGRPATRQPDGHPPWRGPL